MSGDNFEEIINALATVAPHFENTTKRYFEMQVRSRSKFNKNIELDSIMHLESDSNILTLNDLKLIDFPNYVLHNLELDSESLCLDANFNLGNLNIKGKCDESKNHGTAIISITLNNVKANGKIGLSYQGDSFVTENYDLNFDVGDIVVESNVLNDAPNFNEIIKHIIVQQFQIKIEPKLVHLFDMCLGEAVVEISVSELFEEDKYTAYLRSYFDKKQSDASAVLKSFIEKLKTMLPSNLALQYFKIDVSNDVDTLGFFKLNNGHFIDLHATLEHGKYLSSYKKEDNFVFFGKLVLRNAQITYESINIELTTNNIKFSNKTTAKFYEINISIKISSTSNNKLENEHKLLMNVLKIRQPIIDIIDLENSNPPVCLETLQSYSSKIEFWIIENLRRSLQLEFNNL